MNEIIKQTFTLFQWQTTNGAVAQEFFTKDAADAWMKRRELQQAENEKTYFPELKLVKLVTTVETTYL